MFLFRQKLSSVSEWQMQPRWQKQKIIEYKIFKFFADAKLYFLS